MADGIPTSSASLGSKPASLLLAPASAGPAQAASPPLASHFLPPSLAKKAKAQPAKPPGEPHLPLLLPYSKPSDFSGSPWSRKPSCPRPERGSRRRSRPPRDGMGMGWDGLEELPQVTEGSPRLVFGSGLNPTPAQVLGELLLHTLLTQPPQISNSTRNPPACKHPKTKQTPQQMEGKIPRGGCWLVLKRLWNSFSGILQVEADTEPSPSC